MAGVALEKTIDGRCRQLDRQHSAIEHILSEDTRKALGHNQMNTVYLQGPGRMFTGRATAEVRARNDDALAGNIFLPPETIQLKIFKKVRPQRLPGNFSQVLGWNDFVGVNIRSVQKQDLATEVFPRIHDQLNASE